MEARTYPQKSDAFETVKSASLGFLGGAGFTYGFIKVLNGFGIGRWALTGGELAFSATIGGLIAALHGFDRSRVTQIYNDRAGLLNKYQSLQDIQQDVLFQMGNPAHFTVHRHWSERALSQLNNISLVGWFISDFGAGSRKLANFFMTTSGLTAAGWLGAHVAGMEKARYTQQDNLSHVEKVALERAAMRAAPVAQAARM